MRKFRWKGVILVFCFALLITAALFFDKRFTGHPVSDTFSNIPTSGLVGYWRFDGNLNEATGKSTLNGVWTPGAGSATPVYKTSYLGNKYLEITKEYVSVPSLSWDASSTPSISISFWINVPASVVSSQLSLFTIGNDPVMRIQAHTPWTDKKLYWDYGDNGLANSDLSFDFTSYLDKWTHVVLSSSSSGMKIFVNGQQVAQRATGDFPKKLLNGLIIGRYTPYGTPIQFKGSVDEFMIYNRQISALEVSQIYSAQSDYFSESSPDSDGKSFIAVCYEEGCLTIPTLIDVQGASYQLEIYNTKGFNDEDTIDLRYLIVDKSLLATNPQLQEVIPLGLFSGQQSGLGSANNMLGSNLVLSTSLVSNQNLLLLILERMQGSIPQAQWQDIFENKSDLQGIPLSVFNTDSQRLLLQTIFGSSTPPASGTLKKMTLQTGNFAVLYLTKTSGPEIFIWHAPDAAPPRGISATTGSALAEGESSSSSSSSSYGLKVTYTTTLREVTKEVVDQVIIPQATMAEIGGEVSLAGRLYNIFVNYNYGGANGICKVIKSPSGKYDYKGSNGTYQCVNVDQYSRYIGKKADVLFWLYYNKNCPSGGGTTYIPPACSPTLISKWGSRGDVYEFSTSGNQPTICNLNTDALLWIDCIRDQKFTVYDVDTAYTVESSGSGEALGSGGSGGGSGAYGTPTTPVPIEFTERVNLAGATFKDGTVISGKGLSSSGNYQSLFSVCSNIKDKPFIYKDTFYTATGHQSCKSYTDGTVYWNDATGWHFASGFNTVDLPETITVSTDKVTILSDLGEHTIATGNKFSVFTDPKPYKRKSSCAVEGGFTWTADVLCTHLKSKNGDFSYKGNYIDAGKGKYSCSAPGTSGPAIEWYKGYGCNSFDYDSSFCKDYVCKQPYGYPDTYPSSWKINGFGYSMPAWCPGGVLDSITCIEPTQVPKIPKAPTGSLCPDYSYVEWVDCLGARMFGPPTVTVSKVSSTSLKIEWSDSNDASDKTGYRIWRSTSATGTFSLIYTAPATTKLYPDSGLSAGVAYYYKVEVFNSGLKLSENSSIVFLSTATAEAPYNFVVSSPGQSTLSLKWEDRNPSKTGFDVYRSTTGAEGTFYLVKSLSATALSYTDAGLSSSTTYYYKVKVNVAGGFAVSSAASGTTTVANPNTLTSGGITVSSSTRRPLQYIVPFLKHGLDPSKGDFTVQTNTCMNGIKEPGEECDLVPKTLLANSVYCSQSTLTTIGGITYTRDDRGDCGLNCKCAYDSWKVKAVSGGTACSDDSGCKKVEHCMLGVCMPKTYCGDGIVQSLDDDGIAEECEPLTKSAFLSFGVSDIGQCKKGAYYCTDKCKYAVLGNPKLPDLVERCGDGIDNNCNGLIDEGCSCTAGTTQLCGSDVGECKKGVQTCASDGTWGACTGGIASGPEICDEKDNNCNGLIDEGLSCLSEEELSLLRAQALFAVYRSNTIDGEYTQIALMNTDVNSFKDTLTGTYYYKVVLLKQEKEKRSKIAESVPVRVTN